MKLNLSDEYDHKALLKYLGLTLGMTILYKATSGMASIVIPFLVMMSVVRRKPIELLFWVLYMTETSIGNRWIFSNNFFSVMVVRGTLVSLTFMLSWKVFNSRSSRCMVPFMGIMFYALWECVSSLQGYEPVVSYLKLLLFFCIFLAMYGVANEVNASTRVNAKILRSAVLSLVIFVVVGSVLVIPFPGISMMNANDPEILAKLRSGEAVSLFCGMCSHSQAMGPTIAVLGTFVFADLIFSIKKWDALYVFMLLCVPIVIVKTSSRTGMGTFVTGIGMATFLFMLSRGVGRKWKGKIMSVMTGLIIVGLLLVVSVPSTRKKIAKFVMKWDTGDQQKAMTVENVFMSRQGKIDNAMYNFKKKPLIGNGFQVADSMQFEHRSGIFSYLAAPIEKGVWIYAVLEEGGIIGMILFAGWLVILFPVLYARHAYIMASTFFAVIMTNLGEFSLFAMTYIGGYYWTMAFAAATLDVQRMKGQNIQVFDVPIEVVMAEVGMDEWVRIKG